VKKILAVNNDIGGANAIINPILKLIDNHQIDLTVISEGPSQKIYAQKKFSYKTLADYDIKKLELNSFDSIFEQEKPDLLITGTSGISDLERYAIYCAKKFSKPSISVLDGYIDHGMRFLDNSSNDKYRFLPNYICVLDQFSLEQSQKEGLDKSNLIITGNPYFDDLISLRTNFKLEDRIRIRKELNIPETNYLITFASQYITTRIKELGFDPGYTEFTVLKSVYESLKKIMKENLTLLVKIHPDPKEDIENTKKAIVDQLKSHQIIFLRDKNTRQHILASDLIIGMNSASLLEAVYLGKSVLSVQPNLVGEDSLITNKLGLSVPVYKNDDLEPVLEKIIFDKKFKNDLHQRLSKFNLDSRSTERVVNLIYKILKI
jgi:hypothetical protein